MPSEPVWLPITEVIATNRTEVAQTGEPHFLRDDSLLQMAWMRPVNLWLYGENVDLATLAVGLLLGIARLHPFEQGNKRTGLVCAVTFLRINGHDLATEGSEDFADLIIDVVADKRSEQELINAFRVGIIERPLS